MKNVESKNRIILTWSVVFKVSIGMMNIRHVPAVTDAAPKIVNRKQNINVQVSQFVETILNKTAKPFKIQNIH